jgi:hypothetical protein
MTRVTVLIREFDTKMTEKDLQNNIIQIARLLGYHVHAERPSINRRGKWSTAIQGVPGYPDLTLAKQGKVLFIECKSEKGQPTDYQTSWALALPNYYLARPSAWLSGEIERILKGT